MVISGNGKFVTCPLLLTSGGQVTKLLTLI